MGFNVPLLPVSVPVPVPKNQSSKPPVKLVSPEEEEQIIQALADEIERQLKEQSKPQQQPLLPPIFNEQGLVDLRIANQAAPNPVIANQAAPNPVIANQAAEQQIVNQIVANSAPPSPVEQFMNKMMGRRNQEQGAILNPGKAQQQQGDANMAAPPKNDLARQGMRPDFGQMLQQQVTATLPGQDGQPVTASVTGNLPAQTRPPQPVELLPGEAERRFRENAWNLHRLQVIAAKHGLPFELVAAFVNDRYNQPELQQFKAAIQSGIPLSAAANQWGQLMSSYQNDAARSAAFQASLADALQKALAAQGMREYGQAQLDVERQKSQNQLLGTQTQAMSELAGKKIMAEQQAQTVEKLIAAKEASNKTLAEQMASQSADELRNILLNSLTTYIQQLAANPQLSDEQREQAINSYVQSLLSATQALFNSTLNQ